MLKPSFREQPMGRTRILEWFSKYKTSSDLYWRRWILWTSI